MHAGFVVTSADATEVDKFLVMSAPLIFDRKLYARRRLRAENTIRDSFLVRHAAENLSERLGAAKRRFLRALDLSSRHQSFAMLSPHAESWLRTGLHRDTRTVDIVADEETLPFAPQRFDLIVSVLGLHAVNDLPGALVQIRRALTPEGLFMAALFGGATLVELRRALASGEAETSGGASPRVAPFADVRDMGALLQRAGFASPVADVDSLSVRYASFATLVDDLRMLGEGNALLQRRRSFLPRKVLSAALASYEQNDGTTGKFPATFEILYLTGWATDRDR
jgi:SAM-dependent methyltransferase